MLSGHLIQTGLRLLDRITAKKINPQTPAHLRTGKRGEEDAYFYLRHRGYVMVARNYRTARHHGEIDLIGWDDDVLCFIEVKTRTTRDVRPAAAGCGSQEATRPSHRHSGLPAIASATPVS